MITRADAEGLVLQRAHLNGGVPEDSEWMITDVVERPWGWAISYAIRQWVEDRDFTYAVAGNVPIIVDASDGAMLSTRARLTIDEQLDAYERGDWDWLDLTWAQFDAHRRYGRAEAAAQSLVDLAMGSVPDGADPRATYLATGGVAMIERTCLDILDEGSREPLAAVAATCLGHLARLHRSLRDPERVLGTLRSLQLDPDIGGRCQDALDDIATFASSTPASETTWDTGTSQGEADAG